jgi:hypothetical protein
MPEHSQRIWAADNVLPEGGVAQELMMAQMRCEPAATVAPEVRLAEALERLNVASSTALKGPVLRMHSNSQELLRDTHRFQCLDQEGLYFLCKQLNRLILERLDVGLIRSNLKSVVGLEKAGSLKLLQELLRDKTADSRALLSPLAGVYELRHADAHLPASDYTEALKLLGVDSTQPWVSTGTHAIDAAATTVESIVSLLSD